VDNSPDHDVVSFFSILFVPIIPLGCYHTYEWQGTAFKELKIRWSWPLFVRALLRLLIYPLVGLCVLLLGISLVAIYMNIREPMAEFKAARVMGFLAGSLGGLAVLILIYIWMQRKDRRNVDIRLLLGPHNLGSSDPATWPFDIMMKMRPENEFGEASFLEAARTAREKGDFIKAMWAARLAEGAGEPYAETCADEILNDERIKGRLEQLRKRPWQRDEIMGTGGFSLDRSREESELEMPAFAEDAVEVEPGAEIPAFRQEGVEVEEMEPLPPVEPDFVIHPVFRQRKSVIPFSIFGFIGGDYCRTGFEEIAWEPAALVHDHDAVECIWFFFIPIIPLAPVHTHNWQQGYCEKVPLRGSFRLLMSALLRPWAKFLSYIGIGIAVVFIILFFLSFFLGSEEIIGTAILMVISWASFLLFFIPYRLMVRSSRRKKDIRLLLGRHPFGSSDPAMWPVSAVQNIRPAELYHTRTFLDAARSAAEAGDIENAMWAARLAACAGEPGAEEFTDRILKHDRVSAMLVELRKTPQHRRKILRETGGPLGGVGVPGAGV
jgi:hypothetical protein